MLVSNSISEKRVVSARVCTNIKDEYFLPRCPPKAQWMLQIPEILEQLRSLDAQVIDRSVCEKVFSVGRRRAVELMHSFGGYRSGNAVLVEREKLMVQLDALDAGSEVARERRRKDRLAENLDHLHRYCT